MTNHEKGVTPPSDEDPLAHLDFDTPVEVVEIDGRRWMLIDLAAERQKLIDAFFDRIASLNELCGGVDTDDIDEYRAYVRNLDAMLESDAARLDIELDDLIQISGLSYVIHDGNGYAIPKGNIVRGRYQGMALYPQYEIDTWRETLPIALNFAMNDISMAPSDDGESVEYELPVDQFALATLHGLSVRLHKLVPLGHDGETDYSDN